MIKKLLFTFCFIFITFFSFRIGVNANVHTGISYDAHEKFNIFYEMKNNTSMANLLLSKNIEELSSYIGTNTSFYMIFYYDEVKDYLRDNVDIPKNTKYVILYALDSGGLGLKRTGSDYSLSFNSSYYITISCVFFDENAKIVKKGTTGEIFSDLPYSYTYAFSDTSKNDIEQFSYFISKFWYFKNLNMNGMFETTYVTDIIYDDERLLIDDSEVNKNIFTKIKEKWLGLTKSDSLIDARQLNLTYFQKNNYMTDKDNPKPLYDILNYDTTLTPPNGFKSLNFKTDSSKQVEAYFFIPKNTDSSMNRNLYGYTTELPRKSFANDQVSSIKQAVQAFSLNDKNKMNVLSDEYVDYHVKYEQNYKLYDLAYKQKLSKIYPDINFNQTVISVSHAIKYNSVLYYNPKAFDICPLYSTGTTVDSETGATISTYSECSFTNPVTGDKVTLSGQDFYEIASSANGIGASTNIFDDAESQREAADKYGELYETDENGNLTGFSLTNILKQLKSFLKNFIDVITTIFSSFTMFFNALPVEIRGLLYFGLIGGVILLFWKLIH